MQPRIQNIIHNRKARHDYHLMEHFEAGIALKGSEVKSLRNGQGSLDEAFVSFKSTGAWLHGFHIAPYSHANINQHDPLRVRQLLLHKSELQKLRKGTSQRGMTTVPIRVYFKNSRLKVEITLAKGKQQHDKRHAIKDREAKREIRRYKD